MTDHDSEIPKNVLDRLKTDFPPYITEKRKMAKDLINLGLSAEVANKYALDWFQEHVEIVQSEEYISPVCLNNKEGKIPLDLETHIRENNIHNIVDLVFGRSDTVHTDHYDPPSDWYDRDTFGPWSIENSGPQLHRRRFQVYMLKFNTNK